MLDEEQGAVDYLPPTIYEPPATTVLPTVKVLVRWSLFDDGGRREVCAPHGLSLTEIIDRHAADLPPHLIVVSIDDCTPLPPTIWDHVRPKAGRRVFIRLAPQGGGAGGLALQIGLGIAAVGAAYFTGGASLALYAGVMAGTGIALGALFPPQETESATGGRRAHEITGTRNEIAAIGQPIPYVAGRCKVFPLHVALPYTILDEGEQHIRMLLSPGFGPVAWDNIKIGDTPIDDFPDLSYQLRTGAGGESPPTLYPRTIVESGPNVEVTKAGGPITATIGREVTRLNFELTWPEGIYRYKEDKGTLQPTNIEVKIEYRKVGTTPWTVLAQEVITKEVQRAWRKRWLVNVALGDYEGRVTRISDDVREQDEHRSKKKFFWTSFRGSIDEAPVQRDDVALLAISVKAGPEASGILDQINAEVVRVAPEWHSSTQTWVSGQTASPAAAFRDVLQHAGANRGEIAGDDDLDLPELQDWAQRCAGNGRTFNYIFSDEGTVLDRLRAIASAGRATYTSVDGKHSVVQDIRRTEVTQAITPHNSADIVYERTYRRVPHALRVSFIDRDEDWTRQEIPVYNDGRTASNSSVFDDLDLTRAGITLRDRAWEEGRFRLAELTHRRWVATVTMDHEHRAARRGELVMFSHSALLIGMHTGRIVELQTSGPDHDVVGLVLDEAVVMAANPNYGIIVRSVNSDGDNVSTTRTVVTDEGRQTTVALASPIPLSSGIRRGDLFQFGKVGLEAVEAIVRSVRPISAQLAKVELVAHAQPQINLSDGQPIGPYDPHITIPPGSRRPPAKPRLVTVRWDDLTLNREATGVGRKVHLVAVVAPPVDKGTAAEWYTVAFKVHDEAEWTLRQHPATGLDLPFVVEFGYLYDVKVRARATVGGRALSSAWSDTKQINVRRRPTTPLPTPGPTGLELIGARNETEYTGRSARFRWRATGSLGADEIGDEPGNGEAGFRDPTFAHWDVRIYTGKTITNSALRRKEIVNHPNYTYDYEKQYADGALITPANPRDSLAREFTIRVQSVDNFGTTSASARLTVNNPAPRLPLNLSVAVNIGSIWCSFEEPNDPDFVGMIIWASTTSGFAVGPATLLGKVVGNSATFTEFESTRQPIETGRLYYARVAAYDVFSANPEQLDVSAEFAVITGSINLESELLEFDFERGGTGWDLVDEASPLNVAVSITTNPAIETRYGEHLLRIACTDAPTPFDLGQYRVKAKTLEPVRPGEVRVIGTWVHTAGKELRVTLRALWWDTRKEFVSSTNALETQILSDLGAEMSFYQGKVQVPTGLKISYMTVEIAYDHDFSQAFPIPNAPFDLYLDGVASESRPSIRTAPSLGSITVDASDESWVTLASLPAWGNGHIETDVLAKCQVHMSVVTDPGAGGLANEKIFKIRLRRVLDSDPEDPSFWAWLTDEQDVCSLPAGSPLGTTTRGRWLGEIDTLLAGTDLPRSGGSGVRWRLRFMGRVAPGSVNMLATVTGRVLKIQPEA